MAGTCLGIASPALGGGTCQMIESPHSACWLLSQICNGGVNGARRVEWQKSERGLTGKYGGWGPASVPLEQRVIA